MREIIARARDARCLNTYSILILAASVFACGQPDGSQSNRQIVLEPSFINFEAVSIRGQRAVELSITPQGDDFDITNISTTSGKFRFLVPENVRRGLGNGETGSIQVLYRPCPEAWDENGLIEDFDFSKCNRREDEGRIRIVDAKYGWAGEVALLGKPSDPGALQVTCEIVDQNCLAAQVESSPNCSALDFGSLNMGESCEIDIRFENTAGIDAASVSIQSLQLWVAGDETGERIAGDAVGIEGFQNQKFEIAPGQGHSVTLTFTPNATGAWETTADENLGLHIFTESSATKPAWRIDVHAASVAPQVEIYPSSLKWQKSTVGLRSAAMVTVSNSGNAELALKRLYSADANAHLEVPELGSVTVAPGESHTFEVIYLGSEDIFTTEILIETSDPNQPIFAIPVSIEPTPKLCLEPGRMLEIDGEVGDIRLTNCGDGVLTISDLKLEHSDASSAHNSIDDFLIEGCPQNNCQPDLRLCSSHNPGCAVSSIVFHIVYENLDNSPFDIVDFVVTTNDENEPEQRVSVKGFELTP